jgi:hypothetical protein
VSGGLAASILALVMCAMRLRGQLASRGDTGGADRGLALLLTMLGAR